MFAREVLFFDFSRIYRASLGFLGVSQGSWEVLGEPLGVLGLPFVRNPAGSLVVPWVSF